MNLLLKKYISVGDIVPILLGVLVGRFLQTDLLAPVTTVVIAIFIMVVAAVIGFMETKVSIHVPSLYTKSLSILQALSILSTLYLYDYMITSIVFIVGSYLATYVYNKPSNIEE